MDNKFKIALYQMNVVESKESNITRAEEFVEKAASKGADFAILPEMFNCPYVNSLFRSYSEDENGETITRLKRAARRFGIYVVAGSIPERDGSLTYNTSYIIDRQGNLAGRHRKIHLFDIDIDIEGRIKFKESDTLTAGNALTLIDTEFCRIGVIICYDIRFPELFRLMTLNGAKLVIVPAAFNMITGPAHWDILLRTRAVDNQVYIAAASPARDEKAQYVAYGNSMIVSPWGEVTARAGTQEEIIITDIDLDFVEKVRKELPLLKHRRPDLYRIKSE